MTPVATFLISIAGIFLIGSLGEVVFQRTNVPDVIWLIFAGILLGPIGEVVSKSQLIAIAPYFAALTLVVVLFHGGSALQLSELARSARRSSVLAIATFMLAMLAVALVTMLAAAVGILPDAWSWRHGLLVGCILGGSSSIIIMPAMAQAQVEPDVANLVSIESALTDALCVVGTAALIDVIVSGESGGAGPLVTLLRSFGMGTAIGFVSGIVWLLFLRVLNSSEHSYPVTLAALLLLYVLVDNAGGSAALGILTFAVVLGNAGWISHKIGLAERVTLDVGLRGFHRQLTFMVKSFFFVFIGAMLGPPWSLILLGGVLGGVLFAARVPGVRIASIGSGLSRQQRQIVTIALPRGMAAGVLATLPVTAGVPGTEHLPVVVFAAVFTTILIFAIGFPMIRRRRPVELRPVASTAAVAGPVASEPDASPAEQPLAITAALAAPSVGAAAAADDEPIARPAVPPVTD